MLPRTRILICTIFDCVGYGNPTPSAGYQGWGAPAGPQVPAPWSNTYGTPTQQTGYNSYGKLSDCSVAFTRHPTLSFASIKYAMC